MPNGPWEVEGEGEEPRACLARASEACLAFGEVEKQCQAMREAARGWSGGQGWGG